MKKIIVLLLLLLQLTQRAGEPIQTEALNDAKCEEATVEARRKEADSEELNRYQEDFAVLWDALESSYPFLHALKPELGIDIDALHDEFGAAMADVKNDAMFMCVLSRLFSEMHHFAHLDLLNYSFYQNSCCVYSACAETRPAHLQILRDERLSEIYVFPSETELADSNFQYLTQNEASVTYYENEKALYISIPTFEIEYEDKSLELLTEALTQHPEIEHVIFDITKNSGGNTRFWNDLVELFGGQYEETTRLFYQSGGLAEAFFPFYCDDSMPTEELSDAPAWAKELGLDRCILSGGSFDCDASGHAVFNKDVKRWVLTSEKVYSASESFAVFCKNSGWATLVGTKTGGDGIGVDPVMVLLPNTGLLVRFSAFVGENSDGSMNAFACTTPDVELGKYADPLQACLKLIREESK